MVLLQGPEGGLFLMSKESLYGVNPMSEFMV